METFVNKVAESGIITLDLAQYIPQAGSITSFDLKPFLYMEMILKEKDYRAALLTHDWAQYEGKHVAMFCSVDAIIPVWAYMLATTYMTSAASVYFGTQEEMTKHMTLKGIDTVDPADYADKRVVIKGCGDTPIPDAAYVGISFRLKPVVKSLMYGEPCSTVPLYKKK